MLLNMLNYYLRGLNFIDTECTIKNMLRLLSRMLRNLRTGLEVSKLSDCNQLVDSL
jgi:hypothetical protein